MLPLAATRVNCLRALPGNLRYWCPACFSTADPIARDFIVVVNWFGKPQWSRYWLERSGINDAKKTLIGTDYGPDVDAAISAQQEVRCTQCKPETLQVPRLRSGESKFAAGIRAA